MGTPISISSDFAGPTDVNLMPYGDECSALAHAASRGWHVSSRGGRDGYEEGDSGL